MTDDPRTDRIHRAVSADGTQIAGRVVGQGPPLVLIHGGLHDGETAWEGLVPHLYDRFTCYLPSWRGHGLSADASDFSPPRIHEDMTAFVDSIGKPVGVVGWSRGGHLALGAAADSAAVAAVALYEVDVVSLLPEALLAGLGAVVEQMAAAAAEGRLVDAARELEAFVATDDEFAVLETDYLDGEFFERIAGNVPALLGYLQQAMAHEGPQSTDPEELNKVTVPVLLLQGQETLQTQLATMVADSIQHVARHVADPHVRQPLPGLAHKAPSVAPEPIAEELILFFEKVLQPA